jgi:ArsR family metal-binding transcriptional regulator
VRVRAYEKRNSGNQPSQIYKQVVTRLLSSQYQDVFALLVPSCCDKSGTSCYQFFTKLMTVADLLQVVPTRLMQAVRNRSCYELVMSSTC